MINFTLLTLVFLYFCSVEGIIEIAVTNLLYYDDK